MYLASLLVNERKELKFLPGGTTFKLGTRDKIQSNEKIEIPYVISGQKIKLRTELVKSDIFLLLSKPEENEIQIKHRDTLEVNEKFLELYTTSSGYYHIYPTPPLGQDMKQGQFLSGV